MDAGKGAEAFADAVPALRPDIGAGSRTGRVDVETGVGLGGAWRVADIAGTFYGYVVTQVVEGIEGIVAAVEGGTDLGRGLEELIGAHDGRRVFLQAGGRQKGACHNRN